MLHKIGMGTFGSDKYDANVVADAVYTAIKAGYRLFDCAEVYGNEAEIGKIFKKAFDEGLCVREDLFIIGKVWNNHHNEGEIIEACKKSIEALGVEYIDLYFMHWPFPNYHAKGCSVDSRNKDSRPFFADEFVTAWEQMEYLYEKGLAKEIGMSNMTIPKFEAVLDKIKIQPYAHEMELHPSFQQPELFDYCRSKGMVVFGYCPIGSPNRPERDKTPLDYNDLELPSIVKIANERGVHPAEICLRWASQRGIIPIPFATKEKNIVNNLNSVALPYLSVDEMQAIADDDKNCRLVKGHVFLWNGASDWTELWDMDGELSKWSKQGNTWIKNK